MKPTYSNDKTAPRMKKGSFTKQVVTKELYRKWKEKHPEHNLDWTAFYKAWQDIAQTIREETISNPLGVKLQSYCGELKLQYLPHKFESTDHGGSEEVGEKIKHTNLVTRGKVAKIKWERRWAVKFNKMLQFYAFEPTRELNKLAKDHVDSNPEQLRVSRNTLGGHSIWRQL